MMSPLAIYMHVPFCMQKCAYCDFASYPGRQDQWKTYFNALGGEIATWGDELRVREARSIFFGGGTPSIVPAEYIAGALEKLRKHISFAPDIEITLEGNPGTVTPEKLCIYREAGVNRLSFGVQSFDDGLLRNLGRIHSATEAKDAVHMAREAGFENISIDLMYALPGQGMEMWLDTLREAAQLPLTHISAYSLIVEEGTPMHRRVQEGRAIIPDDDAVNEMQRMAVHFLQQHGFARYEISNYARPGCESRHNSTYWQGGEYLGLGCAAHSMMNNMRFSNPPELDRYLAGERMLDKAERSESDRKDEMIMLATRMVRGLDLEKWQREFGEDFLAAKAKQIRKLENYGLIEIQENHLRLTVPGLELQDSVVLELLD